MDRPGCGTCRHFVARDEFQIIQGMPRDGECHINPTSHDGWPAVDITSPCCSYHNEFGEYVAWVSSENSKRDAEKTLGIEGRLESD